MDAAEESNAWGQIVAKAWADETFKKRLLAEPAAVLKESGIEVPSGVQIKIVEDSEALHHFKLPLRPGMDELSDEDLGQAAGGAAVRCANGPCKHSKLL